MDPVTLHVIFVGYGILTLLQAHPSKLLCVASDCNMLSMQEANETEAMRRKREKLEKKQNKVKYSKGRR